MINRIVILSLIVFYGLTPQRARAEIPAKGKAVLTLAGYGAGGGALLGLASMAFGTTSRSVAQGASLGLYAGLLFGAYILVTHDQKPGSYDDSSSPYKDQENSESVDGAPVESKNFIPSSSLEQEEVGKIPPLYVNVLNLEF